LAGYGSSEHDDAVINYAPLITSKQEGEIIYWWCSEIPEFGTRKATAFSCSQEMIFCCKKAMKIV
jgi:hypothetical protein